LYHQVRDGGSYQRGNKGGSYQGGTHGRSYQQYSSCLQRYAPSILTSQYRGGMDLTRSTKVRTLNINADKEGRYACMKWKRFTLVLRQGFYYSCSALINLFVFHPSKKVSTLCDKGGRDVRSMKGTDTYIIFKLELINNNNTLDRINGIMRYVMIK
jgi:hypothetical protein